MATNKIPWQSTLHEARASQGLVYWRPIGGTYWQVVSAPVSAKLLGVYTFDGD